MFRLIRGFFLPTPLPLKFFTAYLNSFQMMLPPQNRFNFNPDNLHKRRNRFTALQWLFDCHHLFSVPVAAYNFYLFNVLWTQLHLQILFTDLAPTEQNSGKCAWLKTCGTPLRAHMCTYDGKNGVNVTQSVTAWNSIGDSVVEVNSRECVPRDH